MLLKIAQNKKAMRYVRYQHKAKADSELLKRMDLVAIPCYHWKPWMQKNKQKNETTIGISVGRSCRWLCASSELSLDFWGSSSVSFSRLQSDFPYTIFTPFRRGVVWNCMKLYSGCLCGKHVEIKKYRYL